MTRLKAILGQRMKRCMLSWKFHWGRRSGMPSRLSVGLDSSKSPASVSDGILANSEANSIWARMCHGQLWPKVRAPLGVALVLPLNHHNGELPELPPWLLGGSVTRSAQFGRPGGNAL